MRPTPKPTETFHISLASPGDMEAERQTVREFFDDYNHTQGEPKNLRFEVLDWESYAGTGLGRAQALISAQTLNKYQDSLALVIGLLGQRFGTTTGTHDSGTEEEFDTALELRRQNAGWPEVKWFLREQPNPEFLPKTAAEMRTAAEQMERVEAFRQRLENEGPAQSLYATFAFRDCRGNRVTLPEQDLTGCLAALALAGHGAQRGGNAREGTADLTEDQVLTAFGPVLRKLGSDDLLAYLRRHTGILVAREEGLFGFPHRSFQEYLAMLGLKALGTRGHLIPEVRADPLWWREVFLLAVAEKRNDRDVGVSWHPSSTWAPIRGSSASSFSTFSTKVSWHQSSAWALIRGSSASSFSTFSTKVHPGNRNITEESVHVSARPMAARAAGFEYAAMPVTRGVQAPRARFTIAAETTAPLRAKHWPVTSGWASMSQSTTGVQSSG